ncbi:MAG TPA: DUF4832 domain-containing protein [Planctomycetota bacterium]|jgi:hypothetical protein|nr:DUF4832 domain-containing protein [Planctomycetota bacterium]OQC21195.1 MAG: hypothetical protein BWX69_01172 [Planctomycetes bacterium ADurb.Bin069]NMD34483.1 DUF4832 domain-containing protein [Planctomycetota bacterium]HNR99128.1 DUF4832 domain-containing protein [Planctomycetota bacterium]HNU25835.1 DUF4832 domain-containing protein [Planctomycetota bacterium]
MNRVSTSLPAALCLVASVLAARERVMVNPADTGAALENPAMGWVFHFYDNVPAHYGSRLAPADTLDDYPGLTVVYLRIPWSYIEPEEGKFNWAVVDAPAQRWIAKGKQVAFRFSCAESWMRWATPEWVRMAGAKGNDFLPGKGVVPDGPFWEPDYDDPVFLEKLDNFLAAAALRYDGDPTVAFIDVGSFGVWGEGHTFHSSGLQYPAATICKHIDLHCKRFKRTLLAANDDFSFQGEAPIAHALRRGLTLRDDSILVQGGENAFFHADLAQAFWPTLPVILESEHYGSSRDRGNWKDGGRYLEAVEKYHASYASIHWWPREFLEENRDLVAKINRRLGYRLQLLEMSWPARVRVESEWKLAARWRNAGVAPCYPGGFPAVTLKDKQGGIAAVFVDHGFDARRLPVGPPDQAEALSEEASFALPFNLAAGEYEVFVSVGSPTGTPRLALPLPGDDGRRRYRLGGMRVLGDFAVRPGPLEKRGERWLLPLSWTIRVSLPRTVRPFCHFDRAGEIGFQGLPDPTGPLESVHRAGQVQLGCEFAVPEGARGRSFVVLVGLWAPDRIGHPGERMIPDEGNPDRRVTIGWLEVSDDGVPEFLPKE